MYGVEAAAEKADIHSAISCDAWLVSSFAGQCCKSLFPYRLFVPASFAEIANCD
jgi:hypothetical protein